MGEYHRLDDNWYAHPDVRNGTGGYGGGYGGGCGDGVGRNVWDKDVGDRGRGGDDANSSYDARAPATGGTRRKKTGAAAADEIDLAPVPTPPKRAAAKPKNEETKVSRAATAEKKSSGRKKAKKAGSKPTNKCVEVTCGKKGCILWVRSFAVFLCSCFVCCTVHAKPRTRWTPTQVRAVHDLTRGTCYYCGVAFRTDVEPTVRLGVWQMDHFFPISQHEELDVIENIVPSCITCNSIKHAQSPFAFADAQHRRLRCQHTRAGRMCLREVTRYVAHAPPLCFDHLVT